MAIEETGLGYFTSQGVLKTDIVSQSSENESEDTSVTDQVAEEVTDDITAQAAAITDAAVVSISNMMGAAGTTYTDGVASLVEEAVSFALQKGSDTDSAPDESSSKREIGGTYQNEIMYAKNDSSTSSAEETSSDDTDETVPKPARRRHGGRAAAVSRKYSEQVATEEIDYNTASTGELRRLAAQGDADAQAELEQREANKVNKG